MKYKEKWILYIKKKKFNIFHKCLKTLRFSSLDVQEILETLSTNKMARFVTITRNL